MSGIAPHHGREDSFGAFVPGPAVTAPPTADGPVSGLSFAAKDLFDIAGLVTGCGNPDWARTHPPARTHAWAVARLLAGGAVLAGRTITDEISLGLLGRNQFFGMPINPAAPDLMPGGSSSGSAAAVAGGLVDIAIGSDSGGSVRIPASFCGLFGLRPTHGRLPVSGLMTQSASFDTVGFFARDPITFAIAGRWLLAEADPPASPGTLLVATDAFAAAEPVVRAALAPALQALRGLFASSREIVVAPEGLAEWRDRQRRLQQQEYYATFREWINQTNPRFSFEVARSLAAGALLADIDMTADRSFRATLRERMDDMLPPGTVLCLPTSPVLPPRRSACLTAMAEVGRRIVMLTCIAGLTGLPQISLPLGDSDGIPVGISLIGARGSDAVLLALASAFRNEDASENAIQQRFSSSFTGGGRS